MSTRNLIISLLSLSVLFVSIVTVSSEPETNSGQITERAASDTKTVADNTCTNQFDFVSLEKTVLFEDNSTLYIYNVDDYHYFYSADSLQTGKSYCADDWSNWSIDTELKY